jgi:signal transduction histidine kinase
LVVRRQGRQAFLFEEVSGVDLVCNVDAFRMEQIFRNILENSLAACRDPVEIVIRGSETRHHDLDCLQLSVRDNGPGLTLEQRERIFEPFFTTKTKGTGLGMAISKRIIEAHGGRIVVGGEASTGAEILLTIPREGV